MPFEYLSELAKADRNELLAAAKHIQGDVEDVLSPMLRDDERVNVYIAPVNDRDNPNACACLLLYLTSPSRAMPGSRAVFFEFSCVFTNETPYSDMLEAITGECKMYLETDA